MHTTLPQPDNSDLRRNLTYLFLTPLTALVIGVLLVSFIVAIYQSQHRNAAFSGVTIGSIDASKMTEEALQTAVATEFTSAETAVYTFTDPSSGQSWTFSPAELGMTVDAAATAQAALDIGRSGGPLTRIRDMFQSWYYGRSLAPVLVLNEGKLQATLDSVASEINRPAISANLLLEGDVTAYDAGQVGYLLDTADLHDRLYQPLTQFQSADIELLVHAVTPTVADTRAVADNINRLVGNPTNFYLQTPLDEFDLEPVTLSAADMAQWLRVEVVEENGRLQHSAFIDENALRHWLRQYADAIYREPINARFYFDDNTGELVLVAPHINGRELDIDATVAKFQAQINTANRSVPFVVKDIVPLVNSQATATQLGITELITQTTTWFYGSPDERKHNIARSAANFFGIVIAPGEEFSFNKYLGSISESDGYAQGFIIINGQTVPGIGGGVCQVSTTLYQTAFNAGFPITERWPHGYMLNYYNDGEGPGMDATVFSPIVDMKFINNTPYHLLIENYYNTELEALTFKFYSTSLGRQVVKENLPWTNIVPPPEEDRWDYIETMEPGTAVQIDWATEGADVAVRRYVYNADGDLLDDQVFVSNYVPVPNVYHYGPGVEPGRYDLIENK